MVRIRLRRMGAKKRPFYRVVVADARSPRDGGFIETLGTYDPGKDPASVQIDRARARHWLDQGAQMSQTVESLFRRAGVLGEKGLGPDPRKG